LIRINAAALILDDSWPYAGHGGRQISLMHRNDGMEGPPSTAAHRRWVWVVLCVLIALGAMSFFDQAMPTQADAFGAQFVTANDGISPCEPGHGLTVGHCHMTVTCSICAPSEVGPAPFVAATTHPSSLPEALYISRAISPQLQPPQYSLSA
jgi:hypothetical protein